MEEGKWRLGRGSSTCSHCCMALAACNVACFRASSRSATSLLCLASSSGWGVRRHAGRGEEGGDSDQHRAARKEQKSLLETVGCSKAGEEGVFPHIEACDSHSAARKRRCCSDCRSLAWSSATFEWPGEGGGGRGRQVGSAA